MKDIYELAIVGAGPAGISMAVEARYADIPSDQILILEKGPDYSQAIRDHYPDDKLVTENYKGYDVMPEGALNIGTITKNDTLHYLFRAIIEHKLKVRLNEAVRSVSKPDASFLIQTGNSNYRAKWCVIAIGILEKPNKPDYPLPRSLKPRIHFEMGNGTPDGDKVLVVGGGDTAFERTLRLCSIDKQVTLSYRRRSFERLEDEARERLLELEKGGRLEILLGSDIARVENAKGLPGVAFSGSAEGIRVFDHIYYCLGGTTPVGFLRSAGVRLNGAVPVVDENHETNVPGLYLIGDLSAGLKGGSVNWAFNSSHAALRKILYHRGCR